MAGAPLPPEGRVAISRAGSVDGQPVWIAQLRKDGLFVEVSASSRELLLEAVRALRPVPG